MGGDIGALRIFRRTNEALFRQHGVSSCKKITHVVFPRFRVSAERGQFPLRHAAVRLISDQVDFRGPPYEIRQIDRPRAIVAFVKPKDGDRERRLVQKRFAASDLHEDFPLRPLILSDQKKRRQPDPGFKVQRGTPRQQRLIERDRQNKLRPRSDRHRHVLDILIGIVLHIQPMKGRFSPRNHRIADSIAALCRDQDPFCFITIILAHAFIITE